MKGEKDLNNKVIMQVDANYIPETDLNTSSTVPVVPLKPSRKDEFSVSTSGIAGMWEVMNAMMNNISAIQQYDANGLIPLSVAEENQSLAVANGWLNVMAGPNNPNSDQAQIQVWLNKLNNGGDPGTCEAEINALTQQSSVHNNLYNQANTFFSGINNGTNQNSSDATQTISTDLQMFQQGPQSEISTITQIL